MHAVIVNSFGDSAPLTLAQWAVVHGGAMSRVANANKVKHRASAMRRSPANFPWGDVMDGEIL